MPYPRSLTLVICLISISFFIKIVVRRVSVVPIVSVPLIAALDVRLSALSLPRKSKFFRTACPDVQDEKNKETNAIKFADCEFYDRQE